MSQKRKYTLRVRFINGVAFHKHTYEAPDMETAVKCGYDHVKSFNPGIPVMEFIVLQKEL